MYQFKLSSPHFKDIHSFYVIHAFINPFLNFFLKICYIYTTLRLCKTFLYSGILEFLWYTAYFITYINVSIPSLYVLMDVCLYSVAFNCCTVKVPNSTWIENIDLSIYNVTPINSKIGRFF